MGISHFFPAQVRDVHGASAAPFDPRREAQLAAILRALRGEHRRRWSAAARHAHHAASRTYSCTEAKRLLALAEGPKAKAAALVPQDPGLRKWPLMAFYRAPVHRDGLPDASAWGTHANLKGRVFDVLLASIAAEAFLESSKDFRRASTRASAIANALQIEQARVLFAGLEEGHIANAPDAAHPESPHHGAHEAAAPKPAGDHAAGARLLATFKKRKSPATSPGPATRALNTS